MKRVLILGAMLLSCIPLCGAPQRECNSNAEASYYADAYADHYQVPRELVHAIITQESNWNPRARSNKGAMGLMQLMPDTATRFGVLDPYEIQDNIGGGVRYLAELMKEFNGELRMVVAAYYCGSHPIERRGLLYRNVDVLLYVKSVRRLYESEVRKHAALFRSTTLSGDAE